MATPRNVPAARAWRRFGALAAACAAFALGGAPVLADGLNGYLELTRTEQDSTTDPLTGEPPTESEASATIERFSFTFQRSLWPNLRLLLGGTFDRVLSDFNLAGVENDFDSRRSRPFIDLRLDSGVHFAEIGYDRLENRSKTNGVTSPKTVRETFSAGLGWRPDDRTNARIQYLRTNLFDDLRVSRDERDDSLQLTAEHRPHKTVRLTYRGGFFESDNRIDQVRVRDETQGLRAIYADSLWRRRMNISADFSVSYRSTETVATGSGEVSFEVFSVAAGSALDDTPLEGILTENAALNNDDTTVGAGVDLGLPPPGGDRTLRNMALDFGVAAEVNALRVWIDREVRPETVATFIWTIYTSANNEDWIPRQVVTNAPISSFENRIEVRFSNQTSRYLKIVVAPLTPAAPSASEHPSILVTELDALLYQQASGTEVRRRESGQRLLYNMRTRLEDSLALHHDLSLQWNDSNDSSPEWLLTNGLSLSRALNEVYTVSGRVAREDGHELSRDRTGHLYSASLTATPAETLRYSVVYSGRIDDFERLKAEENSVYIYAIADLYRGISVNVNAGRSFQSSSIGTNVDTTRVGGAATIVPHRTLAINLLLQDDQVDRSLYDVAEPSTSDRATEISASYTPLGTVYLFASHRLETRTGLPERAVDNYAFSWSPFPYGTLRLNFNYSETERTEPDSLERVFVQSLRWSFRRRSFFDISHQKLTTRQIGQNIDTDTFTWVLHLGF